MALIKSINNFINLSAIAYIDFTNTDFINIVLVDGASFRAFPSSLEDINTDLFIPVGNKLVLKSNICSVDTSHIFIGKLIVSVDSDLENTLKSSSTFIESCEGIYFNKSHVSFIEEGACAPYEVILKNGQILSISDKSFSILNSNN